MGPTTEQACPTQGFMGIPPPDYSRGRAEQGPVCDQPMGCKPLIMNACDLLLQRANDLRRKAAQLEALAGQLPTRMTPEAALGMMQLLNR